MTEIANPEFHDPDQPPLVITVNEREILRVDTDGTFAWGEIDPPADAIELARLLTEIMSRAVPA